MNLIDCGSVVRDRFGVGSRRRAVACASRARLLFCHSRWPRARADGRRSRRRLVCTNGFADISRPFPLFRRRDAFHPLSAKGGGKILHPTILHQTRTRASRCKSIKLRPRSSASQERPSWPGRVSPGARGTSSSASRRTVVTLEEAAVVLRRPLRS